MTPGEYLIGLYPILSFFFLCSNACFQYLKEAWSRQNRNTEPRRLEDWIHTHLNCDFLSQVAQHITWASNRTSISPKFTLEPRLSLAWRHGQLQNQHELRICSKTESDLTISMFMSVSPCSIGMTNISVGFLWNGPGKMSYYLKLCNSSFFALELLGAWKFSAVVFYIRALHFCYWPTNKLFSILQYFFSKHKGRSCLLLLWAN